MGGRVTKDNSAKLAVLIDADNSSAKKIPLILQEVAKYGVASVKRVYGDWSSENLKNWRDVLLPHAITPVQQFAYTSGKDATDMILIINAMDLLYSKALDGFCIVSSDSDFTPLASRIRESGLVVYGFGEKSKTPEAFINACDKFIYIENLEDINKTDTSIQLITSTNNDNNQVVNPTQVTEVKNFEKLQLDSVSTQLTIDSATLQLIYKAIKDTADDDGWAYLGNLGKYLVMLKPDFDVRTFGCNKLSELLEKLGLFTFQRRGSQIFVRKKASFSKFLKAVQDTIIAKYGINQWVYLNPLAIEINKSYPNLDVSEYDCKSIYQALLKIESKYFEFSDDKRKLQLLQSKNS